MTQLKVVLIKPSKYAEDGYVERFQSGLMPNATLNHIASLTPKKIKNTPVTVLTVDEYVTGNLEYLSFLKADPGFITVAAMVGVQSHQFHRALDLAAYARDNGIQHCIIGGPHPMTCDTTQFQGRGISFALAEAEVCWEEILLDALEGELAPVYGLEKRWKKTLEGRIVDPPCPEAMKNYWSPLMGLYPVRGCPYKCSYCSVIKIAGRQIRSAPVATTLESLRRAKKAGIEMIMFVSDNFNKYPEVTELLEAMIEEKLNLPFLCQCDTQVVRQPELISLLGKANCYEMFVGVESFNREVLKKANKHHNQPKKYEEIIKLCHSAGVGAHFSNIIGFPEDTEETIREQLSILKELNPALASFYVLTPIPGTEQYEEYRAADLIWEKNLDRFDATSLTWKHPALSAKQLSELLYRCYVEFYTSLLRTDPFSEDNKTMALIFRHVAKQGVHPMSGGTGKVTLDHLDDYMALRKKYFDIELAPLPDSLELSEEEQKFNDNIDLRKKPVAKTAH